MSRDEALLRPLLCTSVCTVRMDLLWVGIVSDNISPINLSGRTWPFASFGVKHDGSTGPPGTAGVDQRGEAKVPRWFMVPV